jgi:hypothetical protein
LTPEQDQLIQQELLRRNDFTSNALLLIRHTGMRIGECIDLSVDCLRAVGPDQWAIHVPLGKLKTERWVPVDSLVCQLVARLRSMRSPDAPSTGRLLLSGSRGQYMLPRKLRNALRDVATAAGIGARIVPHQMRHTYATEMLRAGVTLAAVMKLLGHKSPHMTLHYLEITQSDLQREYHLALAHPRHLVPSPPTPFAGSPANLDPAGILNSLQSAQHVLEMFRRTLPEGFSRRLLESTRQPPHQNHHRNPQTRPITKISRDWPVKSPTRKLAEMTVRDSSGMGSQPGCPSLHAHYPQVHEAVLLVRTEGGLRRESSKLIPLSAEPAKRAKSFVFRFESSLAHSASARRKPERSVWPSRQFTGVFRSSLKSTVSSLGMPVSG